MHSEFILTSESIDPRSPLSALTDNQKTDGRRSSYSADERSFRLVDDVGH